MPAQLDAYIFQLHQSSSKMEPDPNELLESLSELQGPYDFSIIRLTESLLAGSGRDVAVNGSRTSDASDRSVEGSYCADLETDLDHYKACRSATHQYLPVYYSTIH